jgi:hypothetical protein
MSGREGAGLAIIAPDHADPLPLAAHFRLAAERLTLG